MKRYVLLAPAVLFLFILPFTHTVALRLTCLALAFGVTLYSWYRDNPPALPLKLPLLLTALVALSSLLWSIDPDYSWGEVKNEMGYTLIAFFTFFVLTNSRRNLHLFLGALVLSATVMTLIALVSYWQAGQWDEPGYPGGIHDFSTYVVFILPALLFVVARLQQRIAKTALLLLLIALVFAGYLTLQRIMWFALAAECFVLALLLLYPLPISRLKKCIVMTGVGLVALALAPIGIVAKNGVGYSSAKAIWQVMVADVRPQHIWQNSLAAVREAPLWGSGYGRRIFYKTHPELAEGDGWHAHNILLSRLVQLGIVGLALLLYLFLSIGEHLLYIYRAAHSREGIWIGACGITLLVGALAANMANDSFVRHSALLFWSLIGMWLGYGYRLTNRSLRVDAAQR